MLNMRTGWGDAGWDAPDFNDTETVNWIQPTVKEKQTYKYGCYDYGGTCWYGGKTLTAGQAEQRRFVYTIKAGDAGKTLCQRARLSWNEGTWREVVTPYACAYVPYHYPGYQGTNEPSNQFSDCTQTGTCPNVAPNGGVQLSAGVAGGQTTVTPGESVKFNYTLSNSGPTKSKGLTYKAYTFILKSGTSLSNNSTHMSTYPAGWQNVDCNSTNINSGNASACLVGKNGSGLVIDPSTPKSITSDSYTITNEWLGDPGGQICSYIAVDNNWSVYNDTPANSYAVSNIACVKIGKKPQIQINGSDSYAKNGFTGGSYTDIAINTNRGSYSQYGLLTGSNGSITNFGTAGYTNISSANQTKACKLAYANTTGLTNTNCSLLGKAAINRTISIPTTPASAIDFSSTTISIPDLVSGRNKGTYSFHYTGSSALTINTSTLPAGYHISIYSDQPVIINGNITLGQNTTIETGGGHVGNNGNHNGNQNGNGNNGNNPNANQGNNGNVGYDTPGQTIITSDAGEGIAYSSLADMPSFNLIAQGNIDVNSNVTILTGNYLAANGSLNTCYNATNEDLGLTGKCSTKLKINGAVISKNSPKLLRTFGSGSSSYLRMVQLHP